MADHLIGLIESSKTLPWEKAWKGTFLPTNLATKNRYRGQNLMILAFTGYVQNPTEIEDIEDIGFSNREAQEKVLVINSLIIYCSDLAEKNKNKKTLKKKSFILFF